MAIIIPSSKTYDRQNPKVRDNVIERIEVGAVEVVQDNEYETPVYNESFLNDLKTTSESHTGKLGYDYNGVAGAMYFSWALISSSQSFFTIDLTIPKVKNNKYISKIFNKKKESGENWIGVSTAYQVKIGTATAPVNDITYNNYKMTSYSLGSIVKSSPTTTEDSVGTIPYAETSHSNIANKAPLGSQAIATSTIEFSEKENISTVDYDDSDNDFIKIRGLKILSSSKTTKLGYSRPTQLGIANSITLSGEYIEYEADSIEITIYGNTIGIDLTDNTVYINGKTAKKVHSVDGNELMQTSNYFLESGNSAITTMYGETATQYARGKETATIRCSISDYYQRITAKVVRYEEYSATNIVCYFDVGDETLAYELIGEYVKINGIDGFVRDVDETQIMVSFTTNKVIPFLQDESVDLSLTAIAVDNSTNKMCFEIGDQVIPMVYGADGKDRPMSTYQNGSPKIFQVLGSKIFYDGAVWQELSLQEVDKSENL